MMHNMDIEKLEYQKQVDSEKRISAQEVKSKVPESNTEIVLVSNEFSLDD